MGYDPKPTDEGVKNAPLRQLSMASDETRAALAESLCEEARQAGATEQELWDVIAR
jgi:hypothetical protein